METLCVKTGDCQHGCNASAAMLLLYKNEIKWQHHKTGAERWSITKLFPGVHLLEPCVASLTAPELPGRFFTTSAIWEARVT